MQLVIRLFFQPADDFVIKRTADNYVEFETKSRKRYILDLGDKLTHSAAEDLCA